MSMSTTMPPRQVTGISALFRVGRGPVHPARRIGLQLAALGVGFALAGCGHAAEPAPAGSPSVQPPPTHAPTKQPVEYDISRVDDISRADDINDDFPSGFTVQAHPAKTLQQRDIANSGITAFTGAQVDPPQCRSVIIPPYTEPVVGSEAAGVRAEGDQGNIYVVALRSPQPVPAGRLPAGCDRFSLSGSPEGAGTVETVPAPDIAGVTTSGVKLTAADPDQDLDYLYTAALDDRTSVVVMGSTDEQLDPQKLLADLLVKAVTAVRGR